MQKPPDNGQKSSTGWIIVAALFGLGLVYQSGYESGKKADTEDIVYESYADGDQPLELDTRPLNIASTDSPDYALVDDAVSEDLYGQLPNIDYDEDTDGLRPNFVVPTPILGSTPSIGLTSDTASLDPGSNDSADYFEIDPNATQHYGAPTQPYASLANPAPVTSLPTIGCAENGSCYGDISPLTGMPKTVSVRGYYRRDGTYVRGHYRSR